MVTDSIRPSRSCRSGLAVWFLVVSISLAAGVCVPAQETPPTRPVTGPTPEGPADDYGRGTPRSAMRGFMEACWAGDFERAAAYLDLRRLPRETQKTDGPSRARELCTVIERTIWVDPELLSDAPEGDRDDGQPPRRDLVGTIWTATGPVQVTLDRVPREDGTLIWKISSTTVAKIPALYDEFGYGTLDNILPASFVKIRFFQIQLWQWIGLLLLVVIAFVLSRVIAGVGARVLRRLVIFFREQDDHRLAELTVGPLRLGIGGALFYFGSLLLALSLPVQAVILGIEKAILIASVTWWALRWVDVVALQLADRFVARGAATAVAVLPLLRRSLRVFLVLVALIVSLQNLGFNVSGLLAGLGVGGLAVALAAQETVKNFFGGVALITDQPVRVGDFCRFGGQSGTVEDISLWSTRIRTPDRSLISIPNGQFVALHLENFSKRDRFMVHATVSVARTTTSKQLRQVLAALTDMLRAHPQIVPDTAQARLAALGAAFDIEISAVVRAKDFDAFRVVREDIYLHVIEIIDASAQSV